MIVLIYDSIKSTCHDPSHTSYSKSDRDDSAYHRGYISNLRILQSFLRKRLILLLSFENPSFGKRSSLLSIKKNQVNSAAEPGNLVKSARTVKLLTIDTTP